MSSPACGWRPPICDSRTGAAHLRRGAPCQDASGVWSFLDAGRQAVQLLVVSDGHGGSRYDRSDEGSWLACSVALQAAAALLRSSRTQGATPDDWRQWLARDLPQGIVAGWRRQVLAHDEAHPRSDGAAGSTIPYGATLGLLLLTPRWWGYTGLGDWDLVRLDAAGQGELVSEEPDNPGGGEATYSLCMDGAERFFAARSGLEEIPADSPPFSLLLSSDGIRKSCGTDADFLTLSHYLCGLPPERQGQTTSDLAGALDHISGQGSGDDVSVAIGRWGPLSDSDRRHSLRRATKPLIVQPKREPGAGPQAPAGQTPPGEGSVAEGTGVSSSAAGSVPPWRRAGPWLPVLAGGLLLAGAGVGIAALLGLVPAARLAKPGPFSPEQLAVVAQEATRLCRGEPAASVFMDGGDVDAGYRAGGDGQGGGALPADGAMGPEPGSERLPPEGETGGRPSDRDGAPAASGGDSSASHPPAASRQGADPRTAPQGAVPPADGPGPADGNRAGGRLDQDLISSIRGSLVQRKSLFAGLQRGTRSAGQSPAQTRQDPLGALVAWSALQSGLGPLAESDAARRRPRWIPAALTAWLPDWLGIAGPDLPPPETFNYCPELREALRQQWQLARLRPALPPAAPPSASPQSVAPQPLPAPPADPRSDFAPPLGPPRSASPGSGARLKPGTAKPAAAVDPPR